MKKVKGKDIRKAHMEGLPPIVVEVNNIKYTLSMFQDNDGTSWHAKDLERKLIYDFWRIDELNDWINGKREWLKPRDISRFFEE